MSDELRIDYPLFGYVGHRHGESENFFVLTVGNINSKRELDLSLNESGEHKSLKTIVCTSVHDGMLGLANRNHISLEEPDKYQSLKNNEKEELKEGIVYRIDDMIITPSFIGLTKRDSLEQDDSLYGFSSATPGAGLYRSALAESYEDSFFKDGCIIAGVGRTDMFKYLHLDNARSHDLGVEKDYHMRFMGKNVFATKKAYENILHAIKISNEASEERSKSL